MSPIGQIRNLAERYRCAAHDLLRRGPRRRISNSTLFSAGVGSSRRRDASDRLGGYIAGKPFEQALVDVWLRLDLPFMPRALAAE